MRVSYILNSHLHAAHAGDNALLPAAFVIVSMPNGNTLAPAVKIATTHRSSTPVSPSST
jgi:hypothetical protein